MQVQITISGLDEVLSMLDPAKLQKAIDDGVQQAAQRLATLTQLLPPVSAPRDGWDAVGIPVDTDLMRQSIHAQKTALFGAAVIADTDYASYVAYGTGRMPGRDFFKWELEDFGGVDEVEAIMNAALEKALTPS